MRAQRYCFFLFCKLFLIFFLRFAKILKSSLKSASKFFGLMWLKSNTQKTKILLKKTSLWQIAKPYIIIFCCSKDLLTCLGLIRTLRLIRKKSKLCLYQTAQHCLHKINRVFGKPFVQRLLEYLNTMTAVQMRRQTLKTAVLRKRRSKKQQIKKYFRGQFGVTNTEIGFYCKQTKRIISQDFS